MKREKKAALPPPDQRFAPSTVAAEIATRLINELPVKFGGLAAAHILYLTKVGGITVQGERKAGKIEKVTGQKKYLSHNAQNNNEGWDYIVTLDADIWSAATDIIKERIIFHELRHALHDEKEDGSDDWKLVGHDIETFIDETERYGSGREMLDVIQSVSMASKKE